MIESNVIYNFEDFRNLISSKAKIGTYYLLYDDFYFEQVDKDKNLVRDTFGLSGRYTKSFNIAKYISFKLKLNYSTKELSDFIKSEIKHTKILLTIYNPKNNNCFMLFIGSKDDSKFEEKIINLLEMEKWLCNNKSEL